MSHDHSGHSHDHDDHGHTHAHAPASFGKAFAIGIALNLGFVVIEALYGLISNSVSLLADAGHNLSDVLGLGVAWLGSVLAQRAPTARFTYGLRGSSILAALFNAVFLLVTVGGLSWEAIRRLGSPEPVAGKTMMAVAAIGILVNAVTAWLFASGRKDDINLRGAFLHMASDALVSVGRRRGWTCDPADKLAVDRPGGQSRHQRRHRMGHVGPSARFRRHVDGGGPAANRSRGRAEPPVGARGRRWTCMTCISGR